VSVAVGQGSPLLCDSILSMCNRVGDTRPSAPMSTSPYNTTVADLLLLLLLLLLVPLLLLLLLLLLVLLAVFTVTVTPLWSQDMEVDQGDIEDKTELSNMKLNTG
jgi:hypothetical protein